MDKREYRTPERFKSALKSIKSYNTGLGLDMRKFSKNEMMDEFCKGAVYGEGVAYERAFEWFKDFALDYISGDVTDVRFGLMYEDYKKAMGYA